MYFRCAKGRDNGAVSAFGQGFTYELKFYNNADIELVEENAGSQTYIWNEDQTEDYIRYLTLDSTVLETLASGNNPKQLVVKTWATGHTNNEQKAMQIKISLLKLIRPLNTAAQ